MSQILFCLVLEDDVVMFPHGGNVQLKDVY